MLTDIVLITLAAQSIMIAWFKPDGLFNSAHAFLEEHIEIAKQPVSLFYKLLLCRTCLTYHVVFILYLCLVCTSDQSIIGSCIRFLIQGFAIVSVCLFVSWLSNLGGLYYESLFKESCSSMEKVPIQDD